LAFQRRCLFIAPLKDEESVTRQRSEDVFASLILPAADLADYSAKFIRNDEPGMIIPQIVKELQRANVIIADVTGGNFSVGYELAFAHMMSKCTIPLIKNGSSVPYDIHDMKAVWYDYTDRRSLRSAIPSLVAQLEGFRARLVSGDNPLKHALRANEQASQTAQPAPASLIPIIPEHKPAPPPPVQNDSLSSAITLQMLGGAAPSRTISIRELMTGLGNYRKP
jgi:hypothetical protein